MIITIIGGILIFFQLIGNWVSYGIGIAIGIVGIVLLSKYQVEMSAQKTLKSPEKAAAASEKDAEGLGAKRV